MTQFFCLLFKQKLCSAPAHNIQVLRLGCEEIEATAKHEHAYSPIGRQRVRQHFWSAATFALELHDATMALDTMLSNPIHETTYAEKYRRQIF